MLDIQFIRKNSDLVKASIKAKNVGSHVDIDELLKQDEKRRKLQEELEGLRQQRNAHAAELGKGKPTDEHIAKGKALKADIAEREGALEPLVLQCTEMLQDIPNIIAEDTPEGGEEANRSEEKWGEPRMDEVQDHLTWGEARGLIDFERGAKVAGNKFYFLKGPLVRLEQAVFSFGMDLAEKHGFTPITVPHMVSTETMRGTGYMPRGEERQIYKIEGEDLNLIATAEIPITGYHADEVIEEKNLPLLYAGLSPAYRVEAGAYGKFSRGLYRVHQFNKLEFYIFCKPEESETWHQKLVAVEEELCQALEIPYQRVRIAAGDLGAPAYKKFDIEYWSPSEKSYRELMSCSNVTDYQTRRLNIRYRKADGTHEYIHTLNGTAAAFSRMCIALIENHQQKDGTLRVPEVLRPYLGGKASL